MPNGVRLTGSAAAENVWHGTLGAHLSAQLQRLELVLDQRHRTLILA